MTNTSLRDAILALLQAPTFDPTKDQILAQVRRLDGHATVTHATLGTMLRGMIAAGLIIAEAPSGTWVAYRYRLAA